MNVLAWRWSFEMVLVALPLATSACALTMGAQMKRPQISLKFVTVLLLLLSGVFLSTRRCA